MKGMVGEKGIVPERSEWFRSRRHMSTKRRFFCSKTVGTTAGAHKWSRNGPETVLFWSRRMGAGDVHSRPDRAETLVERILRSAKALHQPQEGAHDVCPEQPP